MKGKSPREQIKMWHLPKLGNIELLHACYVTQTFSRHIHDCYAVGVIESGALGFYYRGENLVASPGTINMAVPGEAHTGHAASESGWKYRMFYLESGLLEQAASEVAGRPKELPYAYLIQTRVMHAKSLLDQRWPIAHAAIETGFVDQSHLTRHFRRILGFTPGQYSKIVQDN